MRNTIRKFLKDKNMTEKVFYGLINVDKKTFLTREEMIEHMANIRIELDSIDVGIFYDYIDEAGYGKIKVEDFEKVMFEGGSRGTYWDN